MHVVDAAQTTRSHSSRLAEAARHQVWAFSSVALPGSRPSVNEDASAGLPALSSIHSGSRQGSSVPPDTASGQSP